MKVLVTGGAGFIGSHLIGRLLRRADAEVTCLDNFNDYYSPQLKRLNVREFGCKTSVARNETLVFAFAKLRTMVAQMVVGWARERLEKQCVRTIEIVD
ncbi:MAG: NAD-dependent epimerase/dehydratase family protein [Pirellulales bacterium]